MARKKNEEWNSHDHFNGSANKQRSEGLQGVNPATRIGKLVGRIFMVVWISLFAAQIWRSGLFQPHSSDNSVLNNKTVDAEEQLANEYQARKLKQQVDEEQKANPKSPKLYAIYGQRGYELDSEKNFKEAEKYYEKMTAAAPYGYKTFDFKKHGEVDLNYARMLSTQGRAKEANAVLSKASKVLSAVRGPGDFVTIQTLNALAQNFDEQKDYEKEELVAKDMLTRLKGKSRIGEDGDSFSLAEQRLAESLAGQKRP